MNLKAEKCKALWRCVNSILAGWVAAEVVVSLGSVSEQMWCGCMMPVRCR